MSKSQRTKGATYEREIATRLGVKRKIGQARDGGNDLDYPPFTIECKRRKTLGTVEGWLAQAKAACVSERPVPLVVGRSDGGESLVIMRFEDFLALDEVRADMREALKRALAKPTETSA